MRELVFDFGFSPELVDRMPLPRLYFWHEQAVEYMKERNRSGRVDQDQLTRAVRGLRRR